MIQESYAECLVKRKTPGAALLIKLLLAAGVILAALSVFVIGPFGFLVLAVMGLFAARVWESLYLEYEYLFAERVFSVDKILNKSKRRKAAEYALDDIQVIGPEMSGKVRDWDGRVKKVLDFTSGYSEARRYAFIYRSGGICGKVLFEPDDSMLRCLRMAAPGRMAE